MPSRIAATAANTKSAPLVGYSAPNGICRGTCGVRDPWNSTLNCFEDYVALHRPCCVHVVSSTMHIILYIIW